MAEVTIAVPVFNGAGVLAESLECLRGQTFGDFEAVVYDNASTDATPEIAAGFAARDPRFRLVRRPENVGMAANFLSAVEEARAPWFMWRADDDLSDPDYVATLLALLKADPGAKLAASTIVTSNVDGGRRRDHPFPDVSDPVSLSGRISLMFRERASWYYGVWDRAWLAGTFARVVSRYPDPWSQDHLLLLAAILRGAVRGTRGTSFRQRFKKATGEVRDRRPGESASELWRRRRRFAAACRAELDMIDDLGTAGQAAVRALLPLWIDRHGHRLSRIARAAVSRRDE